MRPFAVRCRDTFAREIMTRRSLDWIAAHLQRGEAFDPGGPGDGICSASFRVVRQLPIEPVELLAKSAGKSLMRAKVLTSKNIFPKLGARRAEH